MDAKTLNDTIAERIAGCGEAVAEGVITYMTQLEITKRTNALVKGFDKRRDLARDLGKIRADQVSYNEDGSVASSSWSKSKLDEREKAQKALAKMDTALEKALSDKPDFGDLSNLIGNQKQPDETA